MEIRKNMGKKQKNRYMLRVQGILKRLLWGNASLRKRREGSKGGGGLERKGKTAAAVDPRSFGGVTCSRR